MAFRTTTRDRTTSFGKGVDAVEAFNVDSFDTMIMRKETEKIEKEGRGGGTGARESKRS